jgi:hypothetical protein
VAVAEISERSGQRLGEWPPAPGGGTDRWGALPDAARICGCLPGRRTKCLSVSFTPRVGLVAGRALLSFVAVGVAMFLHTISQRAWSRSPPRDDRAQHRSYHHQTPSTVSAVTMAKATPIAPNRCG